MLWDWVDITTKNILKTILRWTEPEDHQRLIGKQIHTTCTETFYFNQKFGFEKVEQTQFTFTKQDF